MINQKMHELEIFKDLIRNDMKKEYLSFETACEMFTNIINEVNKLKNPANNNENISRLKIKR